MFIISNILEFDIIVTYDLMWVKRRILVSLAGGYGFEYEP